MEIERLSARVDADTRAAERALDRLDRKLDKVAKERSGSVTLLTRGEAKVERLDEAADDAAKDRVGTVTILTKEADIRKVNLLGDGLTEVNDTLAGLNVNLKTADKQFSPLMDKVDGADNKWLRLRDAIEGSNEAVSGWIDNVFRTDWRRFASDLDMIEGRIGAIGDLDMDFQASRPRRESRRGSDGGILPGIGLIGESIGDLAEIGDKAEDAADGLMKLGRAGDGASGGLESVSGAAGSAGRGFSLMSAKLTLILPLFLALLPAIVAIGPAIVALGGYVIGLVAAFAPLVGILLALPGIMMGVVGVFAVLALAFKNVIPAIQEMIGAQENATELERAAEQASWNLVKATDAKEQAILGVARARRDAAEQLEDAQFAAQSAQLSEERAIIGLARAYKTLADIQNNVGEKTEEISKVTDYFTGKQFEVTRITYDAAKQQGDLQDALLGVREAELGLAMARDGREDSERRLAELQSKGIENSDLVIAALRAEADARRAHGEALRESFEATKAVTGQGAAFDGLSPAAKTFVETIAKVYEDYIKPLITALETALFPHLNVALAAMIPLLERLEPILVPIVEGFGKMMSVFAEDFFTTDNIDKLQEFGEGLGEFLGNLGPVLATFATAILDMTLAAKPLLDTFGTLLDDIATKFGDAASGKSSIGGKDMGEWFEKTAEVLEITLGLVGNLIGAMAGLIVAMEPFTDWILEGLLSSSEALEDFTNSADGQASIADFFIRLKEPLEGLAGLIGDILGGIVAVFGSAEAMEFLTNFIAVTRETVLPAIFGIFDAMIKSGFLDGLVDLVDSLVTMATVLGKAAGFEEMLGVLGGVASILGVIVDLITLIMLPQALIMGGINTGIDWLFDLFKVDETTEKIKTWFRELPSKILAEMPAWDTIWDGLVTSFQTAFGVIINYLATVWDPIMEKVNAGIGGINKINPGTDIPSVPLLGDVGQTSGSNQPPPGGGQFPSTFEGYGSDPSAFGPNLSDIPFGITAPQSYRSDGTSGNVTNINVAVDRPGATATEIATDIAWNITTTSRGGNVAV